MNCSWVGGCDLAIIARESQNPGIENIYTPWSLYYNMPCGRKRKMQKMRKHKLKKRRRKMRNKK